MFYHYHYTDNTGFSQEEHLFVDSYGNIFRLVPFHPKNEMAEWDDTLGFIESLPEVS